MPEFIALGILVVMLCAKLHYRANINSTTQKMLRFVFGSNGTTSTFHPEQAQHALDFFMDAKEQLQTFTVPKCSNVALLGPNIYTISRLTRYIAK